MSIPTASPPHINTDKPFLIPSCLSNWEPLHWSPADWLDVLPSQVDVRVGLIQHELPHPQWERHTAVKRIATKDLFSESDLHLPTAPKDLYDPTATKDLHLPTAPKDLYDPTATKDLHLATTAKDLYDPSAAKDLHLSTTAKDLYDPTAPKDLHLPAAAKDLYDPSATKDLHLSTTAKDLYDPSATKDLHLSTTAKDLHLPTTPKDLHLPAAAKDLYDPTATKDLNLSTWAYYDYKYLHQVMPDMCHKFPWDSCGFPGRDGRDSTLWVGTKHAHTPCHKDTYGCNLVAQILGTKTWTLFPPEQGSLLLPTRVPYEESSVYSEIDLAHMDNVPEDEKKLLEKTTPYTVTLRPGQVLYVPRHWWHSVVSHTFSITVNTWIESSLDDSARVEEALVRYKVACQCKIMEKEDRDCLLNPNEDDLVESDLSELADLVLDVAQLEAKSEAVNNDINLSNIQKLTHKIEELKPGRFRFENVPVTSLSKKVEKNHLKLLKVSTSEAVIREEAKELRNKIKSGQGV